MNSNLGICLPKGLVLFLVALALAGCSGEAGKSVQPGKPGKQAPAVTSEALKALPTVTLNGAKVLHIIDSPFERVVISASGTFGSNVVQKTDPERIIVILHNALAGEAPNSIEVNDETISRVEIAQLDTGKNPAVRITIGLLGKSTYEVIPAERSLNIDIKKISRK